MEKTDEQLYAELKDLPDFDRLPLPEHWYAKFKIERPSAINMKQYLSDKSLFARMFDPNVERVYINEPAPGGIRPILEVKQPDVEVVSKPVEDSKEPEPEPEPITETFSYSRSDCHYMTYHSTKSNDSEHLQKWDYSNPLGDDDASDMPVYDSPQSQGTS